MAQENQKHKQQEQSVPRGGYGGTSDGMTSECNEVSDRPESIPSWRPTDPPPAEHTGHNVVEATDPGGEGAASDQVRPPSS